MAEDEVLVYLCEDHLDVCLEKPYPKHTFNCAPIYSGPKCNVRTCNKSAHLKFIGFKAPDTVKALEKYVVNKFPLEEIFDEGLAILGERIPAIESLTNFLFFKTRVAPIGGDTQSLTLLRVLAGLLLKDLNINPKHPLTNYHIHEILKKLRLYPIDYEGA